MTHWIDLDAIDFPTQEIQGNEEEVRKLYYEELSHDLNLYIDLKEAIARDIRRMLVECGDNPQELETRMRRIIVEARPELANALIWGICFNHALKRWEICISHKSLPKIESNEAIPFEKLCLAEA